MDPSQLPADLLTQAPTVGVLIWLLISARRTQKEISERFLEQLEKRDARMESLLEANTKVLAVVADRLKNQ